MGNYVIKKGNVNLCVDYFVELLGVLYILCRDQEAVCEAGTARCNEKYINEVKEYFKDHDHSRLTKTLELFSDEYNFNYDAPVLLMLMLSNREAIDKDTLFHDRIVIPDGIFDKFIDDLKEFERRSDFKRFYELHIPMYRTVIENFVSDYEKYNSHEWLVSFMGGNTGKEYYINFMIGITNANYGADIGNKIYANLRPYYKTRYGELPDYSYDPLYFSTLIVHEFAHSFINPLTACKRDEIKIIDPEKYAEVLEEFAYGNSVETLINETVIRGLECLYVKENFKSIYDKYVNAYIDDGFCRINEVIRVIENKMDIQRIIELF